MEKYIVTFEDGQHYLADKYTKNDLDGIANGIVTFIRCSDGKELTKDGEFEDLEKWINDEE